MKDDGAFLAFALKNSMEIIARKVRPTHALQLVQQQLLVAHVVRSRSPKSTLSVLPRFQVFPVRQDHRQILRKLVRPSLRDESHEFVIEDLVAFRGEVEA